MNDNSIMSFGKHKGKKLANIPASYLIYIYENYDLKEDLQNYITENYQQLEAEAKKEKPFND